MARLSTNSIHGHEYRDPYGSHIPPICTGVIYEYIDYELGLATFIDRGNYLRYGREENPTTRALEKVVSKLEGVEDALAFNSGMAAISTLLLWHLKPGDRIVVPMELYSSTFVLLSNLAMKMSLKVEKVWPSAEAIAEAVDRNTSMIFTEAMTNPMNRVIDLDYLSKNVDLERTVLVVDNTLTTPVILKPAKYFGGHNDVVGGVIAGSKRDTSELWNWRRVLGGYCNPLKPT